MTDMPSVAVLISSRDRACSLEQVLVGLRDQDGGLDGVEILIADDGSTDHTAALLSAWQTRLPLRVVATGGVGKSAALNQCLALTEAELLLFTDDDVQLPKGWISAYRRAAIEVPDAAIFGGEVLPQLPSDAPAWLRDPGFRFAAPAFAQYAPRRDSGPVDALPFGPNYAVRRRALGEIRFDTGIGPRAGAYVMGQETRFLTLLQAAGARCHFIAEAVVAHRIRDDQMQMAWLLRRCHNAGYSTYRHRLDSGALQPSAGLRLRLWLKWLRNVVTERLVGLLAGSDAQGRHAHWQLKVAESAGRLQAVREAAATR